MVKTYLRYELAQTFGVTVSSGSNILYDGSGRTVICPALERVMVWHVRQGTAQHVLQPAAATQATVAPEVTSLARSSSSPTLLAVGYSNGSIRLWDYATGACDVTFHGHKRGVSALRFSQSGAFLASGGKDTDVVVWDVVGEEGLYRLKGHKDQVTDVAFIERGHWLVTCSKDTFVRLWDLDTQHCIQTLVGHRCEIWSLDVDPSESRLVTGSADSELRIFEIKGEKDGEIGVKAAGGQPASNGSIPTNVGEGSEGSEGEKKEDVLVSIGSIRRQSTDKAMTVRFNSGGNLLGCQAAGKALELYRVRPGAEALKHAKRRKQRKKEKARKGGGAGGDLAEGEEVPDGEGVEGNEKATVATDEFSLLQVVRSQFKIRSFAFSEAPLKKGIEATMAVSLHNNSLEVYEVHGEDSEKTNVIELPGHRSDVRAVTLSFDSTLLLSCSHNSVKIWNPHSGVCLRTVDSGYGLCSLFVPSNRQAVVGTKEGNLELFDVGGAQKISVLPAHEGAIWSMASIPDGSGFVTASADHSVKFWEYEAVANEETAAKQLAVAHTRTLKMTEDALAVRFSPDGKYIAVALLDATIKVFFADTLKFFLSMYGHKLPVLCIDISSDGALLASGSADKNVKLWGLDFGDCHKSLFAHADSVMQVQFVPRTHYFFTVGKDRLVKYWDGDHFEHLLTLEGHHSEIWALALSAGGDFLVTGGHDRSIRRWERTDEPFFVEEEREKRLETMFEADLEDGPGSTEKGEEREGGVGTAGIRTQETISATDAIIEALDLAADETDRLRAHQAIIKQNGTKVTKAFVPNVLLLGYSPSAYVLHALSGVRTNDMEQALLVEMTVRVAVLLLRMHQSQLVVTPVARPVLTKLQESLRKGVQSLKDVLGLNLAGLGHIKNLLAARSNAPFSDAQKKLAEVKTKLSRSRDERIAEKLREKRKKKRKTEAAG